MLMDKKELLVVLEALEWCYASEPRGVCPSCSVQKPQPEAVHFRSCRLDAQIKKLRAEIRKEEPADLLAAMGLAGWEPHKDLWRRRIEDFQDGAHGPIWEFVTPDADDLTADVFFYTDRVSFGGEALILFSTGAGVDAWLYFEVSHDMIQGEVQKVSVPLRANTRYRGPRRAEEFASDTFPGKTYFVALEIRGVRRVRAE